MSKTENNAMMLIGMQIINTIRWGERNLDAILQKEKRQKKRKMTLMCHLDHAQRGPFYAFQSSAVSLIKTKFEPDR